MDENLLIHHIIPFSINEFAIAVANLQICNTQTFDVLPIDRCGGARAVWPWNKAMTFCFTPSAKCFT
jgi:hypothetical protein